MSPAKHIHPVSMDTGLDRPMYIMALVVFICALTVRLIVLFQFKELNPLFDSPVVDAWKYDTLAREFLRTGTWPEPDAFLQPPAYPFFMALIYKIFEGSYTWARIIQAGMGSLSCVFIFLIGWKIYSHRIGMTAGLITAFYGPLIFFDLDLLAPVLIVFWSTLGLLLLVTGLKQSSRLLLFFAGLSFGSALISWPIIGLACVLTAIFLTWSHRQMPQKAVAFALLFSIGVLIPIAPVFLHNMQKGQMVLVSTNGGINFYIGNNPNWQKTVAMRPGYPWEKIVTLPYHTFGKEQVNLHGSSALFYKEAKKYILSQPFDYLQNLCIKLYQIGFGYELMRNTDLYFFKRYSPVLDLFIFKSTWLKFPFGLLFPFALFGIFFSFRTIKKENTYLLSYLVAVSSGLLLFFVTCRYRVVLVPVLAVYASIGFWVLMNRFRQSRKTATILVTLLAGIIIALNLDLFKQQKHFESRIYKAQAPFTLGRVNLDKGNYETALHWLQESVEIDPTYPDAWVDLGRAKYSLGDTQGAVKAMHAAIKAAPDYPLPYYNLGLIYDTPTFQTAPAVEYYQQFLERSTAYFESNIRGHERMEFVRKRLTELGQKELAQ